MSYEAWGEPDGRPFPKPVRLLARKRFRWTRASYRKAHHLSRLMPYIMQSPDEAPPLVVQYWKLWGAWDLRHGGGWIIDPLTLSVQTRLQDKRNEAAGLPF